MIYLFIVWAWWMLMGTIIFGILHEYADSWDEIWAMIVLWPYFLGQWFDYEKESG